MNADVHDKADKADKELAATIDPPGYDVVIVGGGPAGLSAALALGRSRRRVVVVDAGEPRNAPATHMHGVLGLDGMPPQEFLARGRDDVARYGVTVVGGRAVGARRTADGFDVALADGSTMSGRRLLVTTGVVDQLPAVSGLRERWGRDAVHCPYCHGWEVQDTAIAVIADTPMGGHVALLFRQWSDRVALFLHDGAIVSDEERRTLTARGVPIIDGHVESVVVADDRIVGLIVDGEEYAADTIAVAARTVASSPVLDALGVDPVDHPMSAELGSTYAADGGRTSAPGVWAAGNVVEPMATVPAAMAAGYQTGAMINADLVAEENETARRAEAGHPQMDETFWDERYRSAPALWSGRPNATLVAEVTDLAPGRAIDVGAGEGADAIWLAEHGWTVTAQDISAVALERARQHADAAGPDVADRVTCLHGDLAEAVAQGASFDLVTSHYVHLPAADRMAMVRDLADLVAPGGHLLLVAHHPSDLATGIRRPRRPDVFFTAGEIAAELDERFTVLVAEARPREVDHDGKRITIRDTVLVAQRTR